jgi:hypothetical protein
MMAGGGARCRISIAVRVTFRVRVRQRFRTKLHVRPGNCLAMEDQ